jgi:hypothetical protein
MRNLLSQIKLYDTDRLKGFGPLGETGDAPGMFNKFFTSIIGIISVVAFIWFMFIIITGAIGIMGAGGDKNAVSSNAKKITNGVIGLVILISSLFLIQLIGTILKLDFLLNPAEALKLLKLQ